MENLFGIDLWIVFIVVLGTWYVFKRKRKLPPGPVGLPVLGYLPFLSQEPHLDLAELSKKYGSVFGLNLGMRYTVVVTDYNIAKDLFKQYSTSDRPPDMFHLMPGGVGIAELNGLEWLEQRRQTMQALKNLEFGGTNFERLVHMGLAGFLDSLASHEGRPVDVHRLLFDRVSRNVISLLLGRPVDDQDRSGQDVLRAGVLGFIRTHNQGGMINLFPALCRACVRLGMMGKDDVRAMQTMNRYVRDKLLQHHAAEEGSYVHQYLKEVEKKEKKSFTVANLVGNAQALILAGSDTTSESLMWLFLAMAAHQDVQDRVHEEIQRELGRDGLVQWEHRRKLPFCHAAMLEGQRWRTITPINVLHMTNQDVPVGDYVIPKSSSVIALISAFHTNPQKWEDPQEFRPGRFLDDQEAVLKTLDHYGPFSFGKRVCIGETIALVEVFLFFVSTVQRFRILPPTDGHEPDLTGRLGLVYQTVLHTLRFVERPHTDD